MSEYQYYEFQAIDRPLTEADRAALRALSTRARITTTSFTNHYEWGDFKGDPRQLMDRWFDLHLYLTNWGTRRLMMRLPKRLVERGRLDPFLREVDWVTLRETDEHLIVDICRDEVEEGYGDWDDGSGWLGGLAPLRADVLAGDLRLFYLLWLAALEEGALEPDEAEPLAGLGPLTGALEAAADFFAIDRDLVAVAAERSNGSDPEALKGALRATIAGLADADKTDLLMRVAGGDPHVAAELRRGAQVGTAGAGADAGAKPRTVEALTAGAEAWARARAQAEAERRAEEERRQAALAERRRRKRLDAVTQRGEAVWAEIESEIARRNAAGYEQAAALLFDLQAIAIEDGTEAGFARRLAGIRDRHARKQRFIERLKDLRAR